MKVKKIYLLYLFIFSSFFFYSCGLLRNSTEYLLMSKENRKAQKKYKFIRKLPTVLFAQYTGAVNFFNIILKKNNYFEIISSAMGFSDYYYGKWEKLNRSDSIVFHYFDNKRLNHIDTIGVLYYDKSGFDENNRPYNSTLEFNFKDTTRHRRFDLFVLSNKIL